MVAGHGVVVGRAGVAKGLKNPTDGLLVISPVNDVGEGIAEVNKGDGWIGVELASISGRVDDDVPVGRGGRMGSVATATMSRSEGICADIMGAVGVSPCI
jgi:hypothetical protein